MPYRRYKKKTYARRSKPGWGSSFVRTVKGAGNMALKAYSMAKAVRALVNVEHKFYDTTVAASQASTTPVVTAITNGIAQGADYNQRQGISVKATSLLIRYHVGLPSLVTGTLGEICRVMYFIDNNSDGTAPVAADVLEVTNDVNSPINHSNGKRFRVIYDMKHPLDVNGPSIKEYERYIKLSDHLRWKDSTAAFREGHIYSLYMSTTGTSANEPIIQIYNRVRFLDN